MDDQTIRAIVEGIAARAMLNRVEWATRLEPTIALNLKLHAGVKSMFST
jgi:hypothetical protein